MMGLEARLVMPGALCLAFYERSLVRSAMRKQACAQRSLHYALMIVSLARTTMPDSVTWNSFLSRSRS